MVSSFSWIMSFESQFELNHVLVILSVISLGSDRRVDYWRVPFFCADDVHSESEDSVTYVQLDGSPHWLLLPVDWLPPVRSLIFSYLSLIFLSDLG
jgi:hypothetical protein